MSLVQSEPSGGGLVSMLFTQRRHLNLQKNDETEHGYMPEIKY